MSSNLAERLLRRLLLRVRVRGPTGGIDATAVRMELVGSQRIGLALVATPHLPVDCRSTHS